MTDPERATAGVWLDWDDGRDPVEAYVEALMVGAVLGGADAARVTEILTDIRDANLDNAAAAPLVQHLDDILALHAAGY